MHFENQLCTNTEYLFKFIYLQTMRLSLLKPCECQTIKFREAFSLSLTKNIFKGLNYTSWSTGGRGSRNAPQSLYPIHIWQCILNPFYNYIHWILCIFLSLPARNTKGKKWDFGYFYLGHAHGQQAVWQSSIQATPQAPGAVLSTAKFSASYLKMGQKNTRCSNYSL